MLILGVSIVKSANTILRKNYPRAIDKAWCRLIKLWLNRVVLSPLPSSAFKPRGMLTNHKYLTAFLH